MKSAVLLCQTTFNRERFDEIVDVLTPVIKDLQIFDTICEATGVRQREARELARECNAVVIVGGRTSANTARLASVVEEEGGVAFHVETEDELPAEVETFRKIGVTAGASTPFWLYHRVVERIWENKLKGIRKGLWIVASFLARSYVYIGLGAYALSSVIDLYLGISRPFFSVLAALYIFSMHVINGYSERQAAEINEPAHQQFLKSHRIWLFPASIASGLLMIIIAATVSHPVLFISSLAVLLGVIYQVPLPFTRFRLKDIPASKDLFSSGAWAFFSTILPAWHADRLDIRTWTVAAVVFFVLFVRSLLYDVKDLQGDRMVGRETIPVAIGKRFTQVLSVTMIVIAAGLILFLPWSFFPLMVLPVYLSAVLLFYHRRLITSGVRFILIIDGVYLLLPSLLILAHM